jgi:hypothetical protein
MKNIIKNQVITEKLNFKPNHNLNFPDVIEYKESTYKKFCNSDIFFDCSNYAEIGDLCTHCSAVKNEFNEVFKDYLFFDHEESGITTLYWQPTKVQESNSWKSFQTDKPYTLDSLAQSLIDKYDIEVDAHAYINPVESLINHVNYIRNNK